MTDFNELMLRLGNILAKDNYPSTIEGARAMCALAVTHLVRLGVREEVILDTVKGAVRNMADLRPEQN